MTKQITLIFSLLLAAYASKATVLILDQSANAPTGTYATFTDAQTAAVNGDTILVIPNTTSYGSVNISKPLVVLGVGFNPDTQLGLKSQFTSIVINVNVTAGTKLIGLVSTTMTLGNTTGTISNVIIENCQVDRITHNASIISNVIIRQNVFQTTNNQFPITLTAANQSNIIVTNNIFSSPGSAYGPYVSTGGVVFDNNLFLGSVRGAFYQLNNCLVRNNIFFERNLTTEAGFSNLVFENNLSFNATTNDLPPAGTNVKGSGNLVNQDPLFTNLPTGTVTYDFTMDASLQVGSPALAAGTDGTDLGIYGGSSAFKNTGSVLPVVKQFAMPSNVLQGTSTDADVIITGN